MRVIRRAGNPPENTVHILDSYYIYLIPDVLSQMAPHTSLHADFGALFKLLAPSKHLWQKISSFKRDEFPNVCALAEILIVISQAWPLEASGR